MKRGLYRGERMDVARKFPSEMANITPINNQNFFTFKRNRQKKDKKVPRGPFSSAAGLYRNVTKTIP